MLQDRSIACLLLLIAEAAVARWWQMALDLRYDMDSQINPFNCSLLTVSDKVFIKNSSCIDCIVMRQCEYGIAVTR